MAALPPTQHHGSRLLLALGGNVGEPQVTIQSAISLLHQEVGAVTAVSSLYITAPLPISDRPDLEQPNFLNCMTALLADLDPVVVIERLLGIERELGRCRESSIVWGPRTIDIDIIAYGGRIMATPDLTIPHPRYRLRDFVLFPLREIAPDFIDPVDGSSVHSLIQSYESAELPKTIIGNAGKLELPHAR